MDKPIDFDNYETLITNNIVYKTYKEWSKEGKYVFKGEHGTKINNKFYFSEYQVIDLYSYYKNELRKENNRMINELIYD